MKSKKYCMGKRVYADEEEARRVAEHQMGLNSGLSLRVYPCVACMGWHLTRNKKK